MNNLFGEDGKFRGYLGCDESGKGDYFGPLVVAGAVVKTAGDLKRLVEVGARDSKKVSDGRVEIVAEDIGLAVPVRSIVIEPASYNKLYDEVGNLNKLLALVYARLIDELRGEAPVRELVIVDKFGDEAYLRSALRSISSDGTNLNLYQVPGAEKYPGVAAASIIARAGFLRAIKRLSLDLGIDLPKGATDVVNAGRSVVEKFGGAKLAEVAKLHFKTTRQIFNG